MIDGRRGRKRAEAPASAQRTTRSLGERLVALGVGANMVTAFGVALAAATGVLIGLGDFIGAVALIIVGGLMDTLDGHIAKVAGTASKRGAFFDSVSDRVGDSLIFIGLAWYFVRTHDANAALLPIGILALANLVSYERAKAESLGYRAQGGLMERAERLILLGAALLVANFVHEALVPFLALLAVLTALTAVGRFSRVWRQASGVASTRISPTRALIERRRQA
ncbi:MAG: CDP-alcohol phosphatidyltransferase family protein, partial [Acidimicrobiales bacterium]